MASIKGMKNNVKPHWADSSEYTSTLTASSPLRPGLCPGPIDPHDDPNASLVLRRYALGCEGDLTTAFPRENVLTFFYPRLLELDGKHKDKNDLVERQMRRDLFLLAFAAVQSLPPSDKWSYYQIAGIHGLPHVPYDGATGSWDPSLGSNWWGGYCQHGSPLFPTWHRPYVMLLEQSIIRQAKLLGELLPNAEEAAAVAGMADKLRFPYWDWANHTSRILGIPDVFTVTKITLAYPWKSFSHRRNIPNPLKSFVLPENVGSPIASSDTFNPSAKPNYEVPDEGTPFIPLGYPTVRHVSSAYTSQNDKLNLTFLRNAETTLVEGVQGMFNHKDWLSFSNHYWSALTRDQIIHESGHYSSIELVHDILHDTIGGAGGQMSYTETAAFDPIFFFHHCNVDRLIALWQYCYPTSWIPTSDTSSSDQPDADGTFTIKPKSPVDASTDLTPFRCSSDCFVSSDDVRIIDRDCGYSYPEIIHARKEQWRPARMLYYMLRLYKPSQHFIHMWFLVLERIQKTAFNGPYSIRVFIDLPKADADTPITSPHYAGAIFVFARQTINSVARCANCENRPFMRATLELTKTMLLLGITTTPEMTGDDGTVQPPQNNPLQGEGALKLVYVNRKGDPLPDPPTLPQLTVVYQERVADEQTYEFLLEKADPQNDLSISNILCQNHELRKNTSLQHFPLHSRLR